jgi:uncharacterized membrane protein YfcA
MPVVLGVLTTAGLAGALFGDGVWDWLSALALAAPVMVGSWYAVRRPDVAKAARPPAPQK